MSDIPSCPEQNPPLIYSPKVVPGGHGETWASYHEKYQQSIRNPTEFWGNEARSTLSWFQPFTNVVAGGFEAGDINWFAGGKLNVSYNCIDRHIVNGKGDKVAIIWEGDEPDSSRNITFSELSRETCRIANMLRSQGVRKGDVVTIYMPMIPELAMTMLACNRLGAIHSIVFAGFSAESLRGRINDCHSRFVMTADQGMRGGKKIALKTIVDEAVSTISTIQSVIVFKRTGADVNMVPNRDFWADELLLKERPYCPCEVMDSEDTLFMLYTSGSTGKPKGVAHTTAGYLLNAAVTFRNSFDIHDDDVFACVADCGWITGHTYIVYGPLCNGTTTVMFESLPTYPNPYRYWEVVQKHRINAFYTAPTAIRTLMRFDPAPIATYDLSSLRVLGSVGEPINPEAWRWYNEHVGRGVCSISDTYWQTETGAHLANSLPGVVPMKPGSCALPCYGIEFAVVDSTSGRELLGNNVEGVLCIKSLFPSIARTVYNDHERYLAVYMKPYPGYYFTGDGCRRDNDGFYWITGRVDDVINPSGHRIGTAEVESALVACPQVSEAAVVGFPHEVKGEGIGCFVILREGHSGSPELVTFLKNAVRAAIGPIATPDFIIFTDLPKTRSGKIMRRILRKVAHGEEDSIGDVSTLADPTVVDKLVALFKASSHVTVPDGSPRNNA